MLAHSEQTAGPINRSETLNTEISVPHEMSNENMSLKRPLSFTSQKRVLADEHKLKETYKIMKDAQARCVKQDKIPDRFEQYGRYIASQALPQVNISSYLHHSNREAGSISITE